MKSINILLLTSILLPMARVGGISQRIFQISGGVMDHGTKAPIKQVEVRSKDFSLIEKTDDGGRFVFTLDGDQVLPTLKYTFDFIHDGYAPIIDTAVHLLANGNLPNDIEMRRMEDWVLFGILKDGRTGAYLPNAELTVLSPNPAVTTVMSGDKGLFFLSLSGALKRSESLRIIVTRAGYQSRELAIPPASIQRKEVQYITLCPNDDRDCDGTPDGEDRCPELATQGGVSGCPDEDKDGAPDRTDNCPAIPGSPCNGGCPVSKVNRLIPGPTLIRNCEAGTGITLLLADAAFIAGGVHFLNQASNYKDLAQQARTREDQDKYLKKQNAATWAAIGCGAGLASMYLLEHLLIRSMERKRYRVYVNAGSSQLSISYVRSF